MSMTDTQVRTELKKMDDGELVAWWNILQTPGIKLAEAQEQKDQHQPIMIELLTERGIPHEIGKRTRTVPTANGGLLSMTVNQ